MAKVCINIKSHLNMFIINFNVFVLFIVDDRCVGSAYPDDAAIPARSPPQVQGWELQRPLVGQVRDRPPEQDGPSIGTG